MLQSKSDLAGQIEFCLRLILLQSTPFRIVQKTKYESKTLIHLKDTLQLSFFFRIAPYLHSSFCSPCKRHNNAHYIPEIVLSEYNQHNNIQHNAKRNLQDKGGKRVRDYLSKH